MGLVKVTPKKDVIHAIEFTGKNKEDVRKAVSEFATVREEENDAIALTRKGTDIGKIMYPGQVLVITGTTTQVYSKARFEAEFEVEAKPKAPKKAAAAKEPKAPVPLTPAEEALYGPTPVEATAEELAEMTKAAEEPKAPKKAAAAKEPGKVEAAAAKIAEEAKLAEEAKAAAEAKAAENVDAK